MPNIEFHYDVSDESDYIYAVKRHGAAILRGFLSRSESQEIEEELLSFGEFTPVDRVHGTVREQNEFIELGVREAPHQTHRSAKRLKNMAQRQGVDWHPNRLRAQLYHPGEAGVEWHRDFTGSLLLVAVANIAGVAEFDVRIADEEKAFILEPGDVGVIRSSGLNPGIDDRTYHRVLAPIEGDRMSLGLRQEASKK